MKRSKVIKLTKISVEGLAPREDGKDFIQWDSELRGFGCRVKPSGVRTFCVQYRTEAGESKRIAIGQFGPLTADEARREAKRQLARITLKADPRAERDEARRAKTVGELCNEYLALAESGVLMTRHKRVKAASTVKIDRGRIAHHILPLVGKIPVRDLAHKHVSDMFNAVALGKTARHEASGKLRGRIVVAGGLGTAKKAVQLLSAILGYGIGQGLLTANPAAGFIVPKDQIRRITDPRILLPALDRALVMAWDRGEPVGDLVAVYVAALTGLRLGEISKLQYSQIDTTAHLMRLPTTKTGYSVRPICSAALYALSKYDPADKTDRVFVFPGSRRKDAPTGALPGVVRRVASAKGLEADDKRALEGFSIQHLRHALATLANELGTTEITVAAMLGHAKGGVTSGYVARLDRVLIAEADRIGAAIVALMPNFSAVFTRASTIATETSETHNGDIVRAYGG